MMSRSICGKKQHWENFPEGLLLQLMNWGEWKHKLIWLIALGLALKPEILGSERHLLRAEEGGDRLIPHLAPEQSEKASSFRAALMAPAMLSWDCFNTEGPAGSRGSRQTHTHICCWTVTHLQMIRGAVLTTDSALRATPLMCKI